MGVRAESGEFGGIGRAAEEGAVDGRKEGGEEG